MSNYTYEENGCATILGEYTGLILVVLIIGVSILFHSSTSFVTDEEALERFNRLLPDAQQIIIESDSGNDNVFLHEYSDVQFELLVINEDGTERFISGRCTDGMFREMVCRIYDTPDRTGR